MEGGQRGKVRIFQRGPILVQATQIRLYFQARLVKNCQGGRSSWRHCFSRGSTNGEIEVWGVKDGYMYMKTHERIKTTASCPRDFS